MLFIYNGKTLLWLLLMTIWVIVKTRFMLLFISMEFPGNVLLVESQEHLRVYYIWRNFQPIWFSVSYITSVFCYSVMCSSLPFYCICLDSLCVTDSLENTVCIISCQIHVDSRFRKNSQTTPVVPNPLCVLQKAHKWSFLTH